ncbi:uncharacterized protein BYT42DRAFT_30326 [Radiomyces spectabilis]|uniref:uncharacterized protein n=1 Tax=Radiomyces spectabilis TaxID=64574 RepID=UPI0022200AB7|nr:uncharacterized protein BYT42DRAFT_30326 [Radiomyces spectabilis]KAI8394091.1 hypothetical protein BYT42DRAFT_30326 [Radiomyces spectabilis]
MTLGILWTHFVKTLKLALLLTNHGLGGSSTTRSIPLLSDDGMLRMHPQALVKQFGLNRHPTFAPYDIQSLFNADAPFWFQVNFIAEIDGMKLLCEDRFEILTNAIG